MARGFDFAVAASIFEHPTLERDDDRRDHGETRTIAIGLVQGVEITVVYTDRVDHLGGTERRIISARRNNRHEREAYHETIWSLYRHPLGEG